MQENNQFHKENFNKKIDKNIFNPFLEPQVLIMLKRNRKPSPFHLGTEMSTMFKNPLG